jgi:hypothetical protein
MWMSAIATMIAIVINIEFIQREVAWRSHARNRRSRLSNRVPP